MFWVILLFCQIVLLFDVNVVLMLPWWPDVKIVQSDITRVIPWQLSTGSKHVYLFRYYPLVGILFEVLRIMCGMCHPDSPYYNVSYYNWRVSCNKCITSYLNKFVCGNHHVPEVRKSLWNWCISYIMEETVIYI